MATLNREQWIVRNVSNRHISLGINTAPALKPGDSYDLLLYLTMDKIAQSKGIKTALDRGWITITKHKDDVETETVNTANADTALSGVQESEVTDATDGLDMAGAIAMTGNTLALGDGLTENTGGILNLQGGILDAEGGDLRDIDGIEFSAENDYPSNNFSFRFCLDVSNNLVIYAKNAAGVQLTFTIAPDS